MLSRPRLTISDGTHLTYAADVDIGQTGVDPVTGDVVVMPLRNVPIAHGNNQLIYADAGQAVLLRRSSSGRLEIAAFAKRMPGTYHRVGVTMPNYCIASPQYSVDDPIDLSLSSRALTYGELETYGGYGVVVYGSVALFRGGVFEAFI